MLNMVLIGCSRSIMETVEFMRKNVKIKTNKQRKRMLCDTWNHTIDIAVAATDDTMEKAVIKGFYGCITTSILNELTIDECYTLVKRWAVRMAHWEEAL